MPYVITMNSTEQLVLGKECFDTNCLDIDVVGRLVTDSEIAALGKMMANGDFGRVKKINFVSCTAFIVHVVACY